MPKDKEGVETMSTTMKEQATRRLKSELAAVATQLQAKAQVPMTGAVSGDFLDVAQGVEHQELARLGVSRLAQRARQLQIALSRVSDDQYGVCSECGGAIPAKRLLAVSDATTCVTCQERLERIRLSG